MKKKKLNKVAQAWVKALRSGKVEQAHGRLGMDDGSRCCLGVLCDLAVEAGIIKDFASDSNFLPGPVVDWAGLITRKAQYGKETEEPSDRLALWKDNDGVGTTKKTFSEISAIIESQPEGLFR